MSADVNVLETLAAAKAVSAVTAVPAATSANPAVPSQVEPSGKRIVAEMPGMPRFARSRSSRASSARRSSGVADSGGGTGVGDGVADGGAGGVAPGAPDGPADGVGASVDGGPPVRPGRRSDAIAAGSRLRGGSDRGGQPRQADPADGRHDHQDECHERPSGSPDHEGERLDMSAAR